MHPLRRQIINENITALLDVLEEAADLIEPDACVEDEPCTENIYDWQKYAELLGDQLATLRDRAERLQVKAAKVRKDLTL